MAMRPATPSGLGREDGLEVLGAYTESKAVLIAL
jgi:hypothetical protein